MSKVRLYLILRGKGHRKFRLFDTAQNNSSVRTLFKDMPHDFSITSYELVESPKDADFIVIPESFKVFEYQERQFVLHILKMAKEYNKQILLFLTGDYAHRIHINVPNTLVFTASEYKSARKINEIVFAPFTEDLGDTHGLTWRKKGEKPAVSFCGYAGYPNHLSQVKAQFLHLCLDITGRSVYKRGIAFRKKSIYVLENDSRIHTNFIVRDFFSGNINTINANAKQIRDEYINSIQNTDFVLCPKGDANYSSRFYETLSLGRIPILIDTDMILPFEKQIDYSKFIVRVPHTDINRIGDYVMELWDKLSPDEYIEMQKHAREVYRNYLRFDAYFNKALPLLKEGGVEAVL